MKQIACFPRYQDIEFLNTWMDVLRQMGYKVKSVQGLRSFASQVGESEKVVLNWYEEILDENQVSAVLKYLAKKLTIFRLKRKHIDVLTVVHNRRPHENAHPNLSLSLRKCLCRTSKKIVVLSGATEDMLQEQLGSTLYNKVEGKIVKLPLPNYVDVYPVSDAYFREKMNIPDDVPVFLSLGHIRPYKNVELVLEVASEIQNRELPGVFIVAGKPISDVYWQKLEDQAKNLANVHMIKGFVPDSDIRSLVEMSDAMIVPMNTDSSINSSECMLAFSYKKPVIAPKIGTVLEYPEEYNYSYRYSCQEDHFDRLLDATLLAIRDYQEGYMHEKGENMYQAVCVSNGREAIIEALGLVLEK